MARLDEVFKKSGVPTHTFVPPMEYDRVLVSLRTPGRCIIVEGPSGIGKTSCIKKAIEDAEMLDSCVFLSGRKESDQPLIAELPTMKAVGTVVIDDFHRLPDAQKHELSDYVKNLADEEDGSSKLILIGINRAGQALVEYAPDVLHRVETIRFGRTNLERLLELIKLGERALNCEILIAEELASEAEGSFAMAQILCHEACLQASLLQTDESETPAKVQTSLPASREAVLSDLATRFFPVAREFSTGRKLRREGRAPYLNLLRWLSQSPEGVLDTREAMVLNPALKESIGQVITKGHLTTLISEAEQISQLIHFEPATQLLTLEDPKFLYFIRHLIWSKFSRQVGYFSLEFNNRYDFALSFAGEERKLAEALYNELTAREVVVFYDKQEQHRILGNDVEEYLAPIYRSESRYVVPLLSKDYPKKIWTKFESQNFKQRFGDRSIIPVWFADAEPGMFDESRKYGGLTYDPGKDFQQQVLDISDALCARLAEDRGTERTEDESEQESQADADSEDISVAAVAEVSGAMPARAHAPARGD